MQARQLFFAQEQKDPEGPFRDEKILQVLQEARDAQGNQVGIFVCFRTNFDAWISEGGLADLTLIYTRI